MVETDLIPMRPRRTGERKKASSLMAKGSEAVISACSRKLLDHSAASLKKGLASAPIGRPKEGARLGALKGGIEIKGDIIHSDMEDDWEVK